MIKEPQPWLTRKQALKRSQDDMVTHFEWRCDCTKKESWAVEGVCEICEKKGNVPLKFWHNGASAHVGYICKKCFGASKFDTRYLGIISVKAYMIYFGSALN